MKSNATYIESGSHQAPKLKGSAAAWRQQVQVRFYEEIFITKALLLITENRLLPTISSLPPTKQFHLLARVFQNAESLRQ